MEPIPSSTREQLDSWKERARYLRRSIRCVQRWEKNEELPIQRHQHGRGATVYAEKLDEWWRGSPATFSVVTPYGKLRGPCPLGWLVA
jgi:hypothetical protein